MKIFLHILLICILSIQSSLSAQSLPESLFVSIPGGTFSMGELESDYQGKPGTFDALVHTVTLSTFQMSKTEISNQQYSEFLNAAQTDGLIEVGVETNPGPDNGNTLISGTEIAPDDYKSQAIYNLSGTRVMKDHDNADGDGDSFTGVIEPENPLNIAYIGYDESRAAGDWFYVKNPADANDFDWNALTDYYNYSTVTNVNDVSVLLNDYANWEELSDYPNNLPTVEEVKNWPATFIRWYGAKAFAVYYDLDLPTEAQWEYAAQGGLSFVYATDDGNVDSDGTSANWNHLIANPSRGHVLDVMINEANPYGLYNMAGNVWEWVEDWYAADYYNNTDGATDPVNMIDSGVKVRRGGSWNYHESTLKSAARAKDEKFKGNDHFGFRVVNNSLATSSDDIKAIPRGFKLNQNYPNPFNPTTIISYSVPFRSFVILKIFDVLGKEVLSMISEVQNAGNHSININPSSLTSGIYFYSLQVGSDFSETKKMMLLR